MLFRSSPIIPHVTHTLWRELGHGSALIDERWPQADPAALAQDEIEIVIQVNGKVRGHVRIPVDADESRVREAALAIEHVQKFVADKPIRMVKYVPRRLLNIVV